MTVHKETAELLQAIGLILRDVGEAKQDDGKLSRTELGFIIASSIPLLIKAIKGAQDIPAELRVLDREAMDNLYYGFLTSMDWQPSDETRDKFAIAYDLLANLIANSLKWLNTLKPPVAQVVPE